MDKLLKTYLFSEKDLEETHHQIEFQILNGFHYVCLKYHKK